MNTPKFFAIAAVSVFAALLGACGNGQSPATSTPAKAAEPASAEVDKAALVAQAKGAVMALGTTLKGQLQAAMKASGPAEAVNVCHKIAPELARSVSAEKGMQITRVSLKNRNPEMGEPNAWQTQVLQDFDARRAAGEEPKAISYAAVVGNEFRFMKAVPTEAVCLNCHGMEVKPEVAAMIDKWYPNDKALGYREGDIRGAFVVTKALGGS